MNLITFIVAWLVATFLMSGFSTLYSIVAKQEFREHILLSHIFTKGSIQSLTNKQRLIGWAIHLAFGAFFTLTYELLWHISGVMRSVNWSILFGICIGLLGIGGWMLMFKLSRNRPQINAFHYYIHLIMAHIVFSLGAFWIYSVMN